MTGTNGAQVRIPIRDKSGTGYAFANSDPASEDAGILSQMVKA